MNQPSNDRNKWIRRGVVAAVILMLAAGAGLAQPAGAPPFSRSVQDGPGRMMSHPAIRTMLASYLDLSTAQKEQAEQIRAAARKEAQPYVEQLRQLKEDVAAAIRSGKSEAEVERLAESAGPAAAKLAGIGAGAFARFYALLTPQQKEKLDKLKESFQAHRPPAQAAFGHRLAR